eukprot:2966873-Pyramimonas_sp.AAC.1
MSAELAAYTGSKQLALPDLPARRPPAPPALTASTSASAGAGGEVTEVEGSSRMAAARGAGRVRRVGSRARVG